MTLLEKWNPTRELEKFRHECDDLLERFAPDRGWFRERGPTPMRPAVESYIEADKFIVRVDLPGVEPNNVDIKVTSGILIIKGSREEHKERNKVDYLRREMHYGSFERTIALPEGTKAEDLKATYQNGVLELTAPMSKEAAPKEVKIQIEGAEKKVASGGKEAA